MQGRLRPRAGKPNGRLTPNDHTCHRRAMSTSYGQGSDFQKLMTAVGYLIFQWSVLEAELVADIRRLRSTEGELPAAGRVRGSFSEQMAEWRALVGLKARRNERLSKAVLAISNEIETLRQKRNLVVHHFCGATARAEDGEPHILCQQTDRGSRSDTRITQSELERLIEGIDRCRLSLRGIELRSPV